MQIQYRETKSGFECVHAPSIDLSSVQNGQLNNSRRSHQFGISSHGGDGASVRRSLTRKASKLSFALKGKDKDKERDREKDNKDKESVKDSKADSATLASAATEMSKSTSSSLYNVSSNTHTIKPETGHDGSTVEAGQQLEVPSSTNGNNASRPSSPTAAKTLPPIPRDFAATSQASTSQTTLLTGPAEQSVFEAFSANALSVRFEINIVKVHTPSLFASIYADIFCYKGPLDSSPWYSIPSSRRRWVAVPDACPKGSHRTQTLAAKSDPATSLIPVMATSIHAYIRTRLSFLNNLGPQ